MLAELRIRDLGVIAGVDLVLRPGMTAVTGETGAGKTLLVQAIDLLMGGRAEAVLVRAGASQAEVEGRFVTAGGHDGVTEEQEIILGRVVPVTGRSRAYVDGRMAPATALAETGRQLVDIHGQHAHQSLLSPAVQRQALDAFGAVDHTARADALRRLGELERELAALGGDERSRARELDLLRFQINELTAAGISEPDEDEALAEEEEALAEASAHREAATTAHHLLSDDAGATDAIGLALSAIDGRQPLAELAGRLRSVSAEVAEAAADLRRCAETLQDDPERLEQVRARRILLRELRRKYGDSLADVIAYASEARSRLEQLESHNERVAVLEQQRGEVHADLQRAEREMGESRRAAAGRFGAAVATHLRELAMAGARFEVTVGDAGAGDDVTFLLGANTGEPSLPLAKVASGGELARTMLALRLVLGHQGATGPGTVIFDEVDAGVGGEAALAVGRALAAVACDPAPIPEPDSGSASTPLQVLVVTHLPQVAAFADHQLVVRKADVGGRTVVQVEHVEGEARVVELSRMLSGQPDSAAARDHAQELLATAATRGRRT